jgi:integrase
LRTSGRRGIVEPNSPTRLMPRRSYGSGSLFVRADSRGRETWYGGWRADGRQVKRRLGPKRMEGSRDGLTRAQAERELRRLIDSETPIVHRARVTVDDVGRRYVEHLRSLGRKKSTLEGYESYINVHLAPFFADKPLTKITPADVEGFSAAKAREGQSAKSVRNYLGLLHSIFTFAEKRGAVRGNPVRLVDKPRAASVDADIRFLDDAELEALLRAVPGDERGPTERTLYLTAAMTGLRQGELIALRWRDIDWTAGRIRVRQNYVRGAFGTPKSKRSTRSVPLADRVARELELHFQRSSYNSDDDLVFPHPLTGAPLDRSRLLKRFKTAARRARLKPVRFHDLRHTFGTRVAAQGVPLRTLQEWMGHRDAKTTQIYADYQPNSHETDLINRAFGVTGVDDHAGSFGEPRDTPMGDV